MYFNLFSRAGVPSGWVNHEVSLLSRFKCSNLQMVKSSNLQMFQLVNWVHHRVRFISMFQGSNVPMFKCSNVQMFKCSNVQMFKWSNGPMLECLDILKFFLSEMLYISTRSRGPVCLQVGLITKLGYSQGSNPQMFQCSNVPMFPH